MVKSLTVDVDEKKRSMNNGDVTVDDFFVIPHSPPSLAMWMEEVLVDAEKHEQCSCDPLRLLKR